MHLNFRSDNESPAHPAIFDALQKANQGSAHAYSEDQWSEQLNAAFSALFETDVVVLPLSTGTVANSIALATVTPPWGSVYCHSSAHILSDESGAPEFFGNGLRLVGVEGPNGKMTGEAVDKTLRANQGHGVHSYLPSAFSVTQSTESGSVYSVEEISELTAVAKQHRLATHMDGARFGNAVAALGCHPADLTWRAGIEMLSFGASKNGCLAAEALVFFTQHQRYETAERLRKRSGHLLSKMRYLSAQLLAYLQDDLWLQMAANANRQAQQFAQALQSHPQAGLEFPVNANEVFVRWNAEEFRRLEQSGIEFLMWPGRDDLARFVFSHSTSDEETAALCAQLS